MPKLKITLDDTEYLLLPKSIAGSLYGETNAEFIRIYLCALALAAANHGAVSAESVAGELCAKRSEVDAALAYWSQRGLLHVTPDGGASFGAAPDKEQPQAPKRSPLLQSDTPPSYPPAEISFYIEKNAALSQMFSLAQSILGRMLSSSAISTLYSFYDWLGLSPEVILMLLEYCADMGKKDMRYIEKVAISWHQMGIDSPGAADAFIKMQNKRTKYAYQIKRVLGIEGRSFTPSEQRSIDFWYDVLKASPDLVAFAFDYCVRQTGKLSFAYMNKVLEGWHKDGVKTPEAAAQTIKSFSGAKKVPAAPGKGKPEIYHSGRYDYRKIEQMAEQKMKNMLRKDQ
ncbi:MAG: Replication initiation and membrane attachment [Firmicutes bacterium ADurb.Bin193]|nr:MAG: Replication initiation and membrane attachment [Firmicutes bacterium ADurb.Bin193]